MACAMRRTLSLIGLVAFAVLGLGACGLTYTVTCNADDPTVCTAGKAAVIHIP